MVVLSGWWKLILVYSSGLTYELELELEFDLTMSWPWPFDHDPTLSNICHGTLSLITYFNVLYISAFLMTGGYRGATIKSTEMFLPSSNTSCTLPELPQGRHYHTQDGGLLCGGGYGGGSSGSTTQNSCERFSAGTWTRTSHNFREPRFLHVSWSTAEGVYLIGGIYSGTTSELIKEDGSVEEGFALKYNTS